MDQLIFKLIESEANRQAGELVMIPSENFVSADVLAATGSVLTNKYAEGYPGKRYYTGNQYVDQIEDLAIERAKQLFKVDHANVQPHSGSSANLACLRAFLQPKSKILAISLASGGHLTHGSAVNFSGQDYQIINYEVDSVTGYLDYNKISEIAQREKPQLIISGFTAYPRQVDFEKMAQIATEVGAISLADISHIAGLCVTGYHPSPVASHDLITTTTHKTLRGPRGAIILTKAALAAKVDKAVFPGIQGGPLENVIAAKAVAFKEALEPDFKRYIKQVVANAKFLAENLQADGLKLVSGGTDTHLILIDCQTLNFNGRQGADRLAEIGIYTNANMIPFDPGTPFKPSGIRLGTPALTTLGYGLAEMKQIASLISRVLLKPQLELSLLKKEVRELTANFMVN